MLINNLCLRANSDKETLKRKIKKLFSKELKFNKKKIKEIKDIEKTIIKDLKSDKLKVNSLKAVIGGDSYEGLPSYIKNLSVIQINQIPFIRSGDNDYSFCFPLNSEDIPKIISFYHLHDQTHHFGVKQIKIFLDKVFWKNKSTDIENYNRFLCIKCSKSLFSNYLFSFYEFRDISFDNHKNSCMTINFIVGYILENNKIPSKLNVVREDAPNLDDQKKKIEIRFYSTNEFYWFLEVCINSKDNVFTYYIGNDEDAIRKETSMSETEENRIVLSNIHVDNSFENDSWIIALFNFENVLMNYHLFTNKIHAKNYVVSIDVRFQKKKYERIYKKFCDNNYLLLNLANKKSKEIFKL
ncbi:hypothetical protein ACTFIU_008479 [Dictyostelium citrinum]